MSARKGKVAIIVLAAGLSLAGASCGNPGAIFNDSFLTALGFGAQPSLVPGEAPAVLVEVVNGTSRVVEALLTWRQDEDTVEQLPFLNIRAGGKEATTVICPVQELTLGDVTNLNRVGAIVRLGAGTTDDAFIQVEAFGVLLQDGVNYECGDVVTFTIAPSSDTLSGYRIFAAIRHADE